jgi:uncharacterized Tic20 family protein
VSRKLGAGLALLGVALFVGSCVPLGFAGYRLFIMTPAHVQAIPSEGASTLPALAVANEGLARIAIKATIQTESVQEVTSGATTDYKARYRFPVVYRALDSSGAVLADMRAEMTWDQGEKMMVHENSTSSGGVVTLQHNFEKFPAPASGPLTIEVDLKPDTIYGARLGDVELLVYDGQVSETPMVVTWLAMLAGGMLLGVVGLIFTISSAVVPESVLTESAQVRKFAALCHAAGFLGYLIPLGNIVGVLLAWLVWREASPFVDQQGKEAINFQIATMVYVLASVVLMFVLIGFALVVVLGLAHLVLMIVAAATASNGRPYRYPLIFRLVK